jgi:hypothetical protein
LILSVIARFPSFSGPVLKTGPFRIAIRFELTNLELSRADVAGREWKSAGSFVESQRGSRAKSPETNSARQTAQVILYTRSADQQGHD